MKAPAERANNKIVLDGVQLAIINKRLETICTKMANTLLRTGRSGVLNSARDFSCVIVTAEDELLCVNEVLPIHVLSGPDIMSRTMKEFHPNLKRGDAYLHNSPYHGNSHPADHTILVPVIDDDGVHHFTVLAKAHQADCGNSIPTTYMASARDVYHEGALIFPAVKVQENYKNVDDIIRMCQMRFRVPEQWWGDFLATLGSARIGERELQVLAEDVGWETLHTFARQWFDYSEQRMKAALRKMPAGRSTATTKHDPFPGAPDGIPVKVTVDVSPDKPMIEVDLRDNPDTYPCGLNLSEACARTAAMIGVFNSIDPTVPPNAGSSRRIQVHLREGSCVGIPRHPTSCSVATTNLADRVGNATARAIAELAEGYGMASTGCILPPSTGVISGCDPRTDKLFVNQLFVGWGGGAAAPHTDAWLSVGHIGNSGLSYQDSIELNELRFPIRFRRRLCIVDSGGAGRTKGGEGFYVEFGPIDCEMAVAYTSDGNINAPEGVRGGLSGGAARQYTRDLEGNLQEVDACTQVVLNPRENIVSISCGGGGYGSPLERDARRVAMDVLEGWVSAEKARSRYGVVLNEDTTVDETATKILRRTIKSTRSAAPSD